MKRFLVTLGAFLVLVLSAVPLASVSAAPACSTASNPLSCACGIGNGSKDSAACSGGTADPISGSNGILKKVSLVLATISGIAAIIIIIVAGFQIVTSAGDANKVASARKSIVGAAVGLVIIAVAEAIVLFVVSKL